MKTNKTAITVCTVFIILSGIAVLYFDNTLIQNIAIGTFTGFIVSLVTSIVGYCHEKDRIIEKTESNIKNLYMCMATISNIIPNMLQEIYKTTDMTSLPFEKLSGLSQLNVEFVEKMELGLFDPIWEKTELAKTYKKLLEFRSVIYRIKSVCMDLYTQALNYNICVLKLQNAQMQGMPSSNPEEITYINDLKNLINVRTAKLHEYIAGQIYELDNIAKSFYECKRCKQSWQAIKENLMQQVEDIIKR